MALLALGSQTGCGREFFREWANQDVTEAIYEKSRDPRYRLEVYSWEPPALARFADPYDRDRPPAPPDDFAAQSLSPQPQWPDHRLMMPLEGTGYLKLLDEGARYDSPPPPAPAEVRPKVNIPAPPSIDPGPFRPNPAPATVPANGPETGHHSPELGPERVAYEFRDGNGRVVADFSCDPRFASPRHFRDPTGPDAEPGLLDGPGGR